MPTRFASTGTGACNQTTVPVARSRLRFSGSITVPPPHAITRGSGDALTSATAWRSSVAEGGFAVLGEELGERHAGRRDDEVVGVDERPPEPLRAPAADRRLAHTHQADEDEVARVGLRRAGHVSDAR